MRVFQSKNKNILHFLYRVSRPVIDPLTFYHGVTGYFWYVRDIIRYNSLSGNKIKLNTNLFPILDEKVNYTPFDGHYFYQQLWTFENILKRKPKHHIDVASTYQMSGYLSKIVKTTFIDIRPIQTKLKNLEIRDEDILSLHYKDNSVNSLSCLHVIEHIGLGRYGDTLNPDGSKNACRELSRILAKGGRLYLSTPVGKNRLCFNAHRIHTPQEIISFCKGLTLLSFSVVDDDGVFHENVDYKQYAKANYSCGMFVFTKK